MNVSITLTASKKVATVFKGQNLSQLGNIIAAAYVQVVFCTRYRLPADHGDLVALRANRDANPRDQRSYSSDEKDTASHDDYSQKTNLLLNIDTRHEDSEEYNGMHYYHYKLLHDINFHRTPSK